MMKSWIHNLVSTAATFSMMRLSLALTYALDSTLLQKAASVRKKLPQTFPTSDELFYPSAYEKTVLGRRDGVGVSAATHMRGFCNWIIPGWIMVGQYPGENPELSGPTADEVHSHLSKITQDAGVNLFCSLQSEIPPQLDYNAWNRVNGQVYLSDIRDRKQFPRPFTHYAPLVRSITIDERCQFLHWPIDDLSVPRDSQSLQTLLLKLLTAIDEDNRRVYIHCWGGRGRAGLTAGCLLSLIFPELDATTILDLVQAGYDTRLGAEEMPYGLSKSPQTDSQRQFVRDFVKLRRKQASHNMIE
jgi:hypothetical protein